MLEKILKELQYQTKLLENISMNTEIPKRDNNTKHAMQKSIEMLQKQILSNPAMDANPDMKEMINNMLNIIPKGGL